MNYLEALEMIGKTYDSGYRDTNAILKQRLIEAQINVITNFADELNSIDDTVEFHNKHLTMEPNYGGPRILNTFDLDDLMTKEAHGLQCPIQEQGLTNFEPFGLSEYKSYNDNGTIGNLNWVQKKVLHNFGRKSTLPTYCFWTYNNGDSPTDNKFDSSYTWFGVILWHSDPNKIGKRAVLSDRAYVEFQLKLRQREDLIKDEYLSHLSDRRIEDYKRRSEVLKNYGF